MYKSYLVLGEGKSGTTALYTSINNSVPEPKRTFFEPSTLQPAIDAMAASHVVSKCLTENLRTNEVSLACEFDRCVMIVRDPRDVLVSRLLYRVRDMSFIFDEERFGRFVSALREKEHRPDSWSTVALYRLLAELSRGPCQLDFLKNLHEKSVRVSTTLGDGINVLRYEDFVSGNTADTESYLDMKITSKVDVPHGLRRVARTKSTGDWRNWFTDEDVKYSREAYKHYLEHFKYDDWSRDGAPSVDPATGSKYVEWIAEMRRSGSG